MSKVFRAVSAVVAASLVGYLTVLVIQRKAELAKAPSAEQVVRSEDQRLLRTVVDHTMSVNQVNAVPTYTDFTRELQKGVAKYVQARSKLNGILDSNYDLLMRYPPGGVPAGYKGSYLRQNAAWEKTLLQGTNDQIRALKEFQGDIEAFFMSHPEDHKRMGQAVDDTISEALSGLKPGATLIKAVSTTRARATEDPGVVTLGRYEQARTDFDRWREKI